MSKVIGNNSPLGIILKQDLIANGAQTEFTLDYQVKSAQSLLVVLDGAVQQPEVEYNVNSSGTKIVFATAPLTDQILYILYLGRELTEPRPENTELIRRTFYGGLNEFGNPITDFDLGADYILFEQAVLVFVDGILKSYGTDWQLVDGDVVVFTVAPAVGSTIDIYVKGKETALTVIPNGAVTPEKLDLPWSFESNGDFLPKENEGRNIGSGDRRPENTYLKNLDAEGDVTISGNLIVSGEQTTIDTQTLEVEDNEITINSNVEPGDPDFNGGIRLKRGSGIDALIEWNTVDGRWKVGLDGSLEKIAYDSDLQNHITDTLNPHAVTKSQVGLGSVTNDAQLKRGDNDFEVFDAKSSPVSADLLLVEDSENSFSKKTVSFGDLESTLILQKSQVGLASVTNDAQLKRSAGDFVTFSEKPNPVIGDTLLIEDSQDTNSKKHITIQSIVDLSSSIGWSSVSEDQYLERNSGYVVSGNTSTVELFLPETSNIGDVIEVTLAGDFDFLIINSPQQAINFGSARTIDGSWGYLKSTQKNDSVKLVCVVADSEWNVVSSVGNLEIDGLISPPSLPIQEDESSFITEWRTTTDNESITLPLNINDYFGQSAVHDFIVDWGDDTQDTITSSSQAEKTHTYATAGTYDIAILGTCTNFSFTNSVFGSGVSKQKIYSVKQWGAIGLKTCADMFYNCTNLTIDENAGLGDFSQVSDMSSMFFGCTSLTTVPLFDTSNVTSVSNMFYNCANLTTVPLFDTSNVTSVSNMFYNCANLTTVPLFDTSSVTNMGGIFANCSSLTSVPEFNTSNVTDTSYTFRFCTSLTSVPLFDTSGVINMGGMFEGCTSLITIPLFNSNSVVNMSNIFQNCPLLSDADLNGTKVSISYLNCNLSRQALVDIFNGLATVTERTITITGNPGVVDLTQVDRDIALNKGWTIAE